MHLHLETPKSSAPSQLLSNQLGQHGGLQGIQAQCLSISTSATYQAYTVYGRKGFQRSMGLPSRHFLIGANLLDNPVTKRPYLGGQDDVLQ